MGGCTFSVSLDELRQFSTTLSQAACELTTLADVRDDHGAIFGSDEVRHEVSSFFEHWSDGMHRIGDHVQELAGHVAVAVQTYDDVESQQMKNATPVK